MLSFVPGDVPRNPLPPETAGDDMLAALARLIRALHEASAPPGSPRSPGPPRPQLEPGGAAGRGRHGGRASGSKKRPRPVRNITDPDSRAMHCTRNGTVQAYNCQCPRSDDGLVPAARAAQDANDAAQVKSTPARSARPGPRPVTRTHPPEPGRPLRAAPVRASITTE